MFEKEIEQVKTKEKLSDASPLIQDLKTILDIAVNKKYTLTDISDEIENGNIQVNSNTQRLLLYLNQILSADFIAKKKVPTSIYKDAQDSYAHHVSCVMDQYKDYSKESYGFNLDASIALKMFLEEGFNVDLIELIIKKYSFVKNINDDYLTLIKEGLEKTRDKYDKIMAIDLEKKYTNTIDIYRFFAKKYLLSSNEKILPSQEEYKIISKLYKALIKTYEQDVTEEAQSDLDNWQSDNETIIIPIIKDIINECSPIATEPQRNKEQYIESLLVYLQDISLKLKPSAENIVIYDDEYNKRLLNKQKELVYGEQKDIIDDCLVAKELIETHKDLEAVKNTIVMESKIAHSEDNPKKTVEEYAEWIVKCAQESIDCELNIVDTKLDFDTQLKEITSYQELKNYGINAKILYFKSLLNRISIYPSFVLKLSERDTDIDACESIMYQYKDIDILELKSVLSEFSPRAKLAGIKKGYEERVINAVMERNVALKEYALRHSALIKEYRQKNNSATEGIQNAITMSNFKDCKTAVELFKRNNNPNEVVKIIEDQAKGFQKAPKIYAKNIVNSAKRMLERWKFIEEYTPNKISNNVVNDYLLLLKSFYKGCQYPIPEYDIQATKRLIKSEKYTATDILYTIRDYSPIAVEAGRDSNYKKYVFYSASQNIDKKDLNKKINSQNKNLSPPENVKVRSLHNEQEW